MIPPRFSYSVICWFHTGEPNTSFAEPGVTVTSREEAADHIAAQWDKPRFVRAELITIETFGVVS